MGKNMLIKVGWKKDFVEKSTPVLPISGWMGDNLIKKTENMGWWSGQDILVEKTKLHIDTLYDCLNDMCSPPGRNDSAPVMLGKVTALKYKKDMPPDETGKKKK